ncbi:MAG: xanthine dehydrogenase family protein subunit M [Gemmatimonadales bacterium]
MKPPPFDYVRPPSLEAALAALADAGDAARALAGGQSLIPALNFRLAAPGLLVDLADVDELRGIRAGVSGDDGDAGDHGDAGEGGGLSIGAMVRQSEVERSALVRERCPLLARTMPWIAHPQIRNRGTIGGSLAHADPAAELPAVMLALGATFVARGPGGTRRIPAAEFYVSLFTTALEPGELLVRVEIPPARPGTRFAFEEVSRRQGDFALAGVAVAVTPAPDGTVADAAIALLGVAEGPVAASSEADVLRGRRLDDAAAADAAAAVAASLDPPGDIHATPAYRRHLAGVLTRRALAGASA